MDAPTVMELQATQNEATDHVLARQQARCTWTTAYIPDQTGRFARFTLTNSGRLKSEPGPGPAHGATGVLPAAPRRKGRRPC